MERRTAVAVGVLVSLALLMAGIMVMASFGDTAFNRSAVGMERVARSLDEGEALHDTTIGDLTFLNVFAEGGAVYFRRADEPSGYVWSPHRQPADTSPMRGPWYVFQDFVH